MLLRHSLRKPQHNSIKKNINLDHLVIKRSRDNMVTK